MNILTAMRERLDLLAVFAELDVEPTGLPTGAAALSDASVLEVLRHVTRHAQPQREFEVRREGVVPNLRQAVRLARVAAVRRATKELDERVVAVQAVEGGKVDAPLRVAPSDAHLGMVSRPGSIAWSQGLVCV